MVSQNGLPCFVPDIHDEGSIVAVREIILGHVRQGLLYLLLGRIEIGQLMTGPPARGFQSKVSKKKRGIGPPKLAIGGEQLASASIGSAQAFRELIPVRCQDYTVDFQFVHASELNSSSNNPLIGWGSCQPHGKPSGPIGSSTCML